MASTEEQDEREKRLRSQALKRVSALPNSDAPEVEPVNEPEPKKSTLQQLKEFFEKNKERPIEALVDKGGEAINAVAEAMPKVKKAIGDFAEEQVYTTFTPRWKQWEDKKAGRRK